MQTALNSSLETVLVFVVSKCSNSRAMAWYRQVTASRSRASTSRSATALGDPGGGPLGIFSAHAAAVWETRRGKWIHLIHNRSPLGSGPVCHGRSPEAQLSGEGETGDRFSPGAGCSAGQRVRAPEGEPQRAGWHAEPGRGGCPRACPFTSVYVTRGERPAVRGKGMDGGDFGDGFPFGTSVTQPGLRGTEEVPLRVRLGTCAGKRARLGELGGA